MVLSVLKTGRVSRRKGNGSRVSTVRRRKRIDVQVSQPIRQAGQRSTFTLPSISSGHGRRTGLPSIAESERSGDEGGTTDAAGRTGNRLRAESSGENTLITRRTGVVRYGSLRAFPIFQDTGGDLLQCMLDRFDVALHLDNPFRRLRQHFL